MVGWVFLGVFLLVCHCLGHLHLCLGVVCDLSRSSARLGTHQFCLHKVCRVYGVDDVAVCDIPSTHNILGYGLLMIHFFGWQCLGELAVCLHCCEGGHGFHSLGF